MKDLDADNKSKIDRKEFAELFKKVLEDLKVDSEEEENLEVEELLEVEDFLEELEQEEDL